MQRITLVFTCIFILAGIVAAQIPATWKTRGIGGGGALFSPSINPANHNEIYIGFHVYQTLLCVNTTTAVSNTCTLSQVVIDSTGVLTVSINVISLTELHIKLPRLTVHQKEWLKKLFLQPTSAF